MQHIQNWTIILMLILIISESILRFKERFESSEVKDTLVNLLLGSSSLMVSLGMKGLLILVFTRYINFSLFDIQITWQSLILLFFVDDFYSYWYHRLSHFSRFFWATHVVHHSSQKFNLTVGIRESFFEGVIRFFYWSILCLLGFSPILVFLIDGLILTFNGFIHTEYIHRLGVLDHIFMTPSNHRVHHASNPKYIDKNFGTILILWDKLFGTYVSEDEKPVYGLANGFQSYNPVKINISEFQILVKYFMKTKTLKEKLKVIFGSPGYKPKQSFKENYSVINSSVSFDHAEKVNAEISCPPA